MAPIIQVNVNHSSGAQDCAMKAIKDFDAGLAVICEPYRIPKDSSWVHSLEEYPKVAILWNRIKHHLPMRVIERGFGYVAVSWNKIMIIEGYFSPNRDNREFESYCDSINLCISRHSGICSGLLIIGDFNARHYLWDFRACNTRGNILRGFIENMNLCVLNDSRISTCIRWQGKSSVDVVFANKRALKRVSNWRTVKDYVTLSDHVLIMMDIDSVEAKAKFININKEFPKWSFKKLNVDLLKALAEGQVWSLKCFEKFNGQTSDEVIKWSSRLLSTLCDNTMPRNRGSNNKNAVYWWSDDLAILRSKVIKCRRILTKARSKGKKNDTQSSIIDSAYKGYRAALVRYRFAIKNAKCSAWNNILSDLNVEPWGAGFKIVLGKMKQVTLPICETLSTTSLERIINTLFPVKDVYLGEAPYIIWLDELKVESAEIIEQARKIHVDKKAPGPDGILGRIIKYTLEPFIDL